MPFLLWLAVTLFFYVMHTVTHQYIFSPLITLSCAALCGWTALRGGAVGAWLAALALVVSVVGDWFMCHQQLDPNNFLRGVAGFGVAHIVFMLYAARRFSFRLPALICILALTAAYAVYLKARVLPGQAPPMRLALAAYAAVSLLGLFFALCLDGSPAERALYALGILCIVFSDTMIAESDFVGHKWAHSLILPFYYLCHVLIASSIYYR